MEARPRYAECFAKPCRRPDGTALRNEAELHSTPSQSRLRPFLGCRAPPELFDLTPEPVDLQLLGLHPTVCGKRLHWIRAELLHPIAKKVLVDVDVPRRLRHAHAPGGDLELSTKLAPLHRSPPAPWKHPYLGVNETSSRPLTASSSQAAVALVCAVTRMTARQAGVCIR